MPKLSPVAIVTAITVIIGLSQIFIPMMVGFVGFNKNFNAVLEDQVKSYSFKHSLIDLAVGSAAVGICVMVSVCFRCATVLALVLSLALTITAVVKAVVFEWSAQPTFLGAILVFELVAAAMQAGMDSVVILLRIKASKAAKQEREIVLPLINPAESETDDAQPPKKKVSLGRLFALAKPEKWLLITGTVALFFSSAAFMVIPGIFGQLINTIVSPIQSNGTIANASSEAREQGFDELNHVVVYLVILFAVSSVFSFLRGSLFTLAGERVAARFRTKVFAAVIHQDIAFFDSIQSGELVNRLASDSAVVQNAVTVNISVFLRFSAQAVVGLMILLVLSPVLTGIMMAVVPVVVFGAVGYGKFLQKVSKKYQKSLSKGGEVASEVLANARTVRSFAKEPAEVRRYAGEIQDSYRHGRDRSWAYGGFAGAITFLSFGAITVVLWYGGRLVISGAMDAGTLVSFLLYTIFIAGALGNLSSLWGSLMSALGASERMFELLDRVPSIESHGGKGLWPQTDVKGEVVLTNVSFNYPSRDDVVVLDNVNLQCRSGEVLALVGPSGAGKSTVVALIERFYDPTSGSVSIDGHDIKTLDHDWLHSRVALVSQEPVLFACSIRDNIMYGARDPTQVTTEQIEAAAKQANAHDFVMEFPDGYDTMVGERGVQLSGGQKQRIAIARAILLDPLVLLLDEATSALDAESEHLVQTALDALMVDRTTIVIAHRLSTVRTANCVAVLDHGKVVETGTHEQLIENPSGLYYFLVQRQLESVNSTSTNVDSSYAKASE